MLDPNRLRVFRSVVINGSVQAAADLLGLTPSAVSQQMSALQRDTGLVLFERRGRGIAATPAAHALLEQSEQVMEQLARLDDVVTDLKEGRSGRLSIGYFASAGAVWLPAVVKRLTAERPDLILELVLTEDEHHAARPDLDLVAEAAAVTARPGYHRVHLADDPYVVLLPGDHALARRRRVRLEDLQGETWVSNDDVRNVGHRIVVDSCVAAGFTPRFTVQAQDQYTAAGFVAAGVGISVMPRLAATHVPDGVRRVPVVDPEPVRRIIALVREGGAPNRAAERAVELLTRLYRSRR